jgi:hypothetical protein
MKIKKELIKREIAGDVILVPVGKAVVESNGLFVLNELGAFLWDRIPIAQSEDDLVSAVLEEYEVSHETAEMDVHEFVQNLTKLGIL